MKHTVKRITFFVFSIIIALLCVFSWQKPVDSYAQDVTITVNLTLPNVSNPNFVYCFIYDFDTNSRVITYSKSSNITNSLQFTVSLNPLHHFSMSGYFDYNTTKTCYFSSATVSNGTDTYSLTLQGSSDQAHTFEAIPFILPISFSIVYDTSVTSGSLDRIYFTFDTNPSTPTPDPTPTPTAAPDPTPTLEPALIGDQAFWGRVTTYSSGFWGVLRSIFTNLFGNTVTRNLCVYLPLMGLILTLIIYFISFGGRDG